MPGVTPEQARLYTDPARGELDMVFQFEHMSVDQSPTNKFDYLGLDLVVLKKSLHRWQAALAETGWNSLYWNNHDQPRVVSRFGDDDPDYWAASAKALATVLHGMRGTPFVYQGEELGMTNYPFRIPQDHKDLEAVNYYKNVLELGGDEGAALAGLAKISRDNARTPMQWDAGPNAGFTTGDPWLPVNPNYTWLNAAAQIDATDTVFAHYQASHSPPPRIAHPGGWRLHAADGGRPADLGVHQNHRERETPRDRQLRTRSPDRRNRPRLDRGRSAARQPARCPGHVDVDVTRPGRLGRAHLLRCPLTDHASGRTDDRPKRNRRGVRLC